MRVGSPLNGPVETLQKAYSQLSRQREECQRAIRIATQRVTELDKEIEAYGIAIEILREADNVTDYRR